MNKFVQSLFIWLFPFYPFWGWLCYTLTNKPIDFFVGVLLFPIALFLIVQVNKKLPAYIIFLIMFAIYHVGSEFVNNLFSADASKVYSLFADPNIIACLFFIIIEYTFFDEKFISRMNKQLLLIVIISFIVSLIQIKIPSFFFNGRSEDDLFYIGEDQGRNFSIYSWLDLNSLGISFPFLISILLSIYYTNKSKLPIIIFCGIVVSFLTKARYVMISFIVVMSQMFFNKKKSLIKRISFLILIVASIFVIGLIAQQAGFDINKVIDSRILEKEGDMGSAKARVTSYEVFLKVFPLHPFFGVGPKTRPDVIELLNGEAPIIHIGYLSYLYYYGIVGCLFFFLSIFYLLKRAWTIGKEHHFWGSFYGLISFCLANLTTVYFNLSEMGIVLAVIYLRYYTTEQSQIPQLQFSRNRSFKL